MAKKASWQRRLSRREMLGLIGAAGVVMVVGCGDDEPSAESTTSPTRVTGMTPTSTPKASASGTGSPAPVSCLITPDLTEGPYFVDEMLNRSDIRSDPTDGTVKEGVPLRIRLTVSTVDGETCTPLVGAVVDMWHCDASGLYSDVAQNSTLGQKFLRGYQTTDESGQVQFLTIYPGWYTGRTVHIHFKVRTDPESQQGSEFTSQFFFDESVTDLVYAGAPYSSRGSRNTKNASDNIFAQSGGELTLELTEDGEGYSGEYHVGLNVA